jgi:dynein heavy chain
MEDIFWSGTPLLESVGNLEPHIVELKSTISQMLRQAMIPLKAYAKVYERYTLVNNLNIDTYIKLVSYAFRGHFLTNFVFVK